MNDREYQLMYQAEQHHWWYRALHELILRFVAAEAGWRGAETEKGLQTDRVVEASG